MFPPPTRRSEALVLAAYAQPDLVKSLVSIATSIVPYIALLVISHLTLGDSAALTAALVVLAGGFLVRTFVVFHDCTHGSLLPSKRANRYVGRIAGLLVLSPFGRWRHDHAVHHATSGDLSRRGTGDVLTLTITEYRARSWSGRLGLPAAPQSPGHVRHRADHRHGGGPEDRHPGSASAPAQQRAGHRRRAAGDRRRADRADRRHQLPAGVGPVGPAGGLSRDLAVLRAASVRGRLLAGSGRVGLHPCRPAGQLIPAPAHGPEVLHREHRAAPRPPPQRPHPNYNLQRAHDELPVFHEVPTLSLLDGLRAVNLKLFDEDAGKLVTFAQARALATSPRVVPTRRVADRGVS
jgi:hypothetical protein